MTVASQLLWSLAPPLVTGTDDVVLPGMLEPCCDMGGAALDNALNGDVLHLAVFDLSAHRHGRAAGGAGLADAYAQIDAAVTEQHHGSRFVTAVLAELDLPSGRLRWVSAGHPAPLLLRDGRLVKTLDTARRSYPTES